MMVVRVLLLAMWALGAQAAEKTSPVLIGHVYDPEAFKPTALPYRGDFDRLMTEYEALDGETFRVRREDFGGSAEAEWLIVSPERRCGAEGCAYTLIDDQHAREIGRFLGSLIVLKRQQNGYAVVQTLNRHDEGFSSVRTYVYSERTYQVEDDVLIGEAARLRLMTQLEQRR